MIRMFVRVGLMALALAAAPMLAQAQSHDEDMATMHSQMEDWQTRMTDNDQKSDEALDSAWSNTQDAWAGVQSATDDTWDAAKSTYDDATSRLQDSWDALTQ